MNSKAVDLVQEHYDALPRGARLAERFYAELFRRAPELRPLFPADLTPQIQHFEQTLDLVITNLGRLAAVDSKLRELGARHLRFGAQPQHYLVVRDVLLDTLRDLSGGDWNPALHRAWKSAINAILVPMLRGAAVETAALAQILASED